MSAQRSIDCQRGDTTKKFVSWQSLFALRAEETGIDARTLEVIFAVEIALRQDEFRVFVRLGLLKLIDESLEAEARAERRGGFQGRL